MVCNEGNRLGDAVACIDLFEQNMTEKEVSVSSRNSNFAMVIEA